MVAPARVITDRESQKSQIIEYINKRLPEDGLYSEKNIKISTIIYDWVKNHEHKDKVNTNCEYTNKITIERTGLSKFGEGLKAFFFNFIGLECNKYELDRDVEERAKAAVEALFSEEKMEVYDEEFKSLYKSCTTIAFYKSLESENKRGPCIENSKGMIVVSKTADVAQKVLPIALAVITTTIQAVKSCTII
jgi:hypothetical protein